MLLFRKTVAAESPLPSRTDLYPGSPILLNSKKGPRFIAFRKAKKGGLYQSPDIALQLRPGPWLIRYMCNKGMRDYHFGYIWVATGIFGHAIFRAMSD